MAPWGSQGKDGQCAISKKGGEKKHKERQVGRERDSKISGTARGREYPTHDTLNYLMVGKRDPSGGHTVVRILDGVKRKRGSKGRDEATNSCLGKKMY